MKRWGEERLKGYWHISRHIQRRKDNSRIASYHHRLPFSSSSGAKVIYGRSLDRIRFLGSNSMYLNIRRLEDYQKIRSEKYLGINAYLKIIRGLKCLKIIEWLKFLIAIIEDEKIQSLYDKRIKSLSAERIKLSWDYNYRTLSNYHLNTWCPKLTCNLVLLIGENSCHCYC